jgi:hypothetical protein
MPKGIKKNKGNEVSAHLQKRFAEYGITLPQKEHKVVKLDLTEPHQKYFLKDGTEVDGTTRALVYIPKPALVHWGAKLGREGKSPDKELKTAGRIGTIAHFLCQCDLLGWEPDLSDCDGDEVKSAQVAFGAYRTWFAQSGLRPVAVEMQLVSECYRFGGTIDLIGLDENEDLTLVDFKTSNGLYESYDFQVAAYATLFEENFRRLPIRNLLLVRMDKTKGVHQTRQLTSWKRQWEVYVALLRLAKRIKDISAWQECNKPLQAEVVK